MAATARVLLFGDQVIEKTKAIRSLYRVARCKPQLLSFLNNATTAVQGQLWQLSIHERQAFGHFSDLLELAERYGSQSPASETVGAVLITAAQIGDYIVYCLDQPVSSKHGPFKVAHLGVCVGLLAAALATAEDQPHRIAHIGAEIVAVSLRLGARLERRSRMIEDTPESWGCTLVSNDLDLIRTQVNELNQGFPPNRHAYIGMSSNAWTTVFGPPSTTTGLATLTGLRDIPQLRLSAAVAVHARHLPALDITAVLGQSPLLDTGLLDHICMSCSKLAPFHATTLRDLLSQAIEEIAQEPIALDGGFRALSSILRGAAVNEIHLTALGPTLHLPMAKQILAAPGISVGVLPSPSATDTDEYEDDDGHIAIVGMSGRFPGASTIEEFWSLLREGRATHETIPASRFPIDEYYSLSDDERTAISTRYGCFLREPGLFDNRFFNISPREAMQMDPLQRMLLMVTHEALTSAGHVTGASSSSHPSRIAAYFGQTTEDWRTINDQQGADTHYLPGSNRAFAPGRLNHYFRWGGGYYSIDTACSSSSTAVHLACHALQRGECDTAVVGGGSLTTIPELFSGLSKGGFLSATGGCKPFSDDADGYCRGEAVGVVVLKRLKDVERERDTVLAVIRGTARNSNAGEGSISHPGERAQEALFRKLLRDSNTAASDISFVEMHGTGTQAGDTVEMRTVHRVFGAQRSPENPLHVGAVKANVGHSEAAAGVVSIIKAVLMLRENEMPPQPGYPFPINRSFPPLEQDHVHIAGGSHRILPERTRNRIVINGFDAAAGNTSILLENAPLQARPLDEDPRSHHVVAVSARTLAALANNKQRLRQWLEEYGGNVRIADVAYTTTARTSHEGLRETYVVQSIEELMGHLDQTYMEQPSMLSSNRKSIVFAFTGQGSQFTGMGAQLYHTSPTFRAIVDGCEAMCAHMQLGSFVGIIRGEQDAETASASQNQLAITVLEISVAKYLQSLGVEPSLVVGHSLGEYAALCAAGALSVHDVLYLVHARAKLVEAYCNRGEYSMLAVSAPCAAVATHIERSPPTYPSCEIACINGPSATVVSGKAEEIRALKNILETQQGVRGSVLGVPYGFHSAQIEPVLKPYANILKGVEAKPLKTRFVSTLNGELLETGSTIGSQYLIEQMRRPVDMNKAMQTCQQNQLIKDDDIVLEVGPQPVCIGLIQACLPHTNLNCQGMMRKGHEEWSTVSLCLSTVFQAGFPVAWTEFHREFSSVQLMQLPTYAWDCKDFWVPYQPQRLIDSQTSSTPVATAQERMGPVSLYLHSVESLTRDDDTISATFTSSTAHPDFWDAIAGHRVDEAAICPAAVFVNMAVTTARFLLSEVGRESNELGLEVRHMEMTKPFVLPKEHEDPKTLRVSALLDHTSGNVTVQFTVDGASGPTKHASCTVLVSDDVSKPPMAEQWARMQKLVQSRIQILTSGASRGLAHRMMRPLIYRLFSALVDYSSPYHALGELLVDDAFQDAAAYMDVQATCSKHSCSPYTIDALVHLAGFLLNASWKRQPDMIHIANSISSLQVLEDLTEKQRLTCYAMIRDQNNKGGSTCDVYVVDEDEHLVAVATGIGFQALPRSVFAVLIGQGDAAAATTVRVATQPTSKEASRPARSQKQTGNSSTSSSQSASERSVSSSRTSLDAVDLAECLLKTISFRTGVPAQDMSDTTSFQDIGVDSPMTISILGEFRKLTGIELPAAFLSEFPTVRDVRQELNTSVGGEKKEQSAPVAAEPVLSIPNSRDQVKAGKGSKQASKTSTNAGQVLVDIIASNLGTSAEELDSFEAAGLDSAMAIKIASMFQRSSGIELPAAFFSDNPTMAQALIALDEDGDGSENQSAKAVQQDSKTRPSAPPSKRTRPRPTAPTAEIVDLTMFESRAQLIQGRSRSRSSPLFLATDGSGTTTGYIHLKPLAGDRRIYGLESPFLESPEKYTVTIQQMAQIFIRTIRKIQPQGPYLIGGWSAGAIYAYEIAYQLVAMGERISQLMLMDMRVPHSVPDAEEVTMAFVEKCGAFTGITRAGSFLTGLSDRQKMHLTSTVRALIKYDPLPFPIDRQPTQTHLIWATKGLNESPNPEERDDRITGPAAMGPAGGQAVADMSMEEFEIELKSWFFARRYDFGMNGWEDFVGRRIAVSTVDADHFSMVAKPQVEQLAAIVQKAIPVDA